MHFISAFLFGISANIDTLIVGFSYGIKKQHIPFHTNILISLITFLGTLLSIGVGLKLAVFLPKGAAQVAGSVLLILLGLYYCLKYFLQRIKKDSDKESSLKAQSQVSLTAKETLLLGAALSVNNAGMGIGASLTGIHFLLTSFITLFLSAAFLITGNRIGTRWAPRFIQSCADLVSGLIIAAMGIYELLL